MKRLGVVATEGPSSGTANSRELGLDVTVCASGSNASKDAVPWLVLLHNVAHMEVVALNPKP